MMKKLFIEFTALSLAMMPSPYSFDGNNRGRYAGLMNKNKYSLPDLTINRKTLPKGLQISLEEFSFIKKSHLIGLSYKIIVNGEVSWSNAKTRIKAIAKLNAQLEEFINKNSIQKIQDYPEFDVIEIEKTKIEIKLQKGDYEYLCYRTICNNKKAIYYNHSTKKHYCQECADFINNENRKDALRLYGHELCILV